jgi:hypothetical protein
MEQSTGILRSYRARCYPSSRPGFAGRIRQLTEVYKNTEEAAGRRKVKKEAGRRELRRACPLPFQPTPRSAPWRTTGGPAAASTTRRAQTETGGTTCRNSEPSPGHASAGTATDTSAHSSA